MRLAGKTALITAAGQGIGRATAEAFVAEGAEVWASDIDGAKVADIDGAGAFALDVTDAAAVAAAFDRTGPVDILFNCAGYVADGAILDCSGEEWERSFAINVGSMRLTIQAYLPAMIERGGGRIINMASVASSVRGINRRAAYGATKAAVIGLTKSVAIDYVEHGVTCNAVCPGTVDTPSLAERIDAHDDPVAARRLFTDRQAMGRFAAPEEIAALVVYIASDEAAFMTGQAVIIDGGISL
jgi:2-keto-3-deoxy-L-fuconate dehydrogenase